MKKEFCTYEQSLALKELGFDEGCLRFYFNPFGDGYILSQDEEDFEKGDILAPLKQQAFRFFREKYQLRGFIGWRSNIKKWDCHIVDMKLNGSEYVKQRTLKSFQSDPILDTYEEAEDVCLDKLIELGHEQFKARQKELLIQMMRGDEELGLYENE